MSDFPLSKYSAKIKDVYIELKNYQFFHGPYDESATKGRFIGREKVKNRIISILKETKLKSGSYLITGFRGMGKTSVVREAIDEFNNDEEERISQNFINLIDTAAINFLKLLRFLAFGCFAFFTLQYFYYDKSDIYYGDLLFQLTLLSSAIWGIYSILLLIKNLTICKDYFGYKFKSIKNNIKSDLNNIWKVALILSQLFVYIIFSFLFIILLIKISFFLYSGVYDNWSNFQNLDAFPKFLLLLGASFIIIIIFLILYSNEIFKAIWNSFKLVFIITLFILSTVFFLNYTLICKNGLCSSIDGIMKEFFPPVNFQKIEVLDRNTDTNNFNINVSIPNQLQNSSFKKNSNALDITSNKAKLSNTNTNLDTNEADLKESNSSGSSAKTEANLFTIAFRLIISILFTYIILSAVIFLIDLIYFLYALGRQSRNKNKLTKYERFEINLSQDSLDEMEILRRITVAIEGYWQKHKFELDKELFFKRKFYFLWRYIINKTDRPRKSHFEPSYKSIAGKLSLLKSRMSGHLTTRRERKAPPNITTPIADLFEIEMPLGGDTNNDEISYPMASVKEAEDQLREILSDIDKLRKPNKKLNIPEFVFIIDELDKIDPHNSSIIQDGESSNYFSHTSIYGDDTNRFRQRREVVGKLLANLKGFLNVAKAKFFFIGGREMFDADLAGIADRESFYSSIFNDVIYVESFFKDSIKGKTGGITQMTETYICSIILNDLKNNKIKYGVEKLNLESIFSLIENKKPYLLFNDRENKINWLKKLINWLKGLVIRVAQVCPTVLKQLINKIPFLNTPFIIHSNQSSNNGREDETIRKKYKIISTLQNYIVYLTYRSSGTPKKLTGLTEQRIERGPKFNKEDRKEKNEQFFNENLVVLHNTVKDEEDLSEKLFLKFGFNTQYEIGLTSNLYRPYLIANSRPLKSLGDKLLFSSSYIIDHILKFHPFGFSWRNLEFIPEVVLVNREPNLREFIEELMRFYSLNFIRDTVSGIFDYRFRSIIRRELIYLSKTSDLSAAAFNFTLDESLATKRYYKRKFNELDAKYKGSQTLEGDNQFVHSIYFLQTILGDLHFYDKEYDDAILYYTESIQTLRLPNAITDRKITRHQFLLWVKNKLKLGLTLEKIRSFDSAFSIYKTLVLDSERYFENIVSKKDSGTDWFNDNEDNLKQEAEDHRSIHLISMPFVALLAVTEKLRSDGITYTNLYTNREDFYKTIKFSEADLEKDDLYDQTFDKYRKFYLIADYYNNVGSLIYYKNCQFIRYFYNKDYYLEAFRKETDKSDLITLFRSYFEDKRGLDLITQQKQAYEISIKPYDFFPSLSPFNFYWNSLYFLLKYHQDRLVDKVASKLGNDDVIKDALKDNLLALCAGYLLPDCVHMVSSNRLYYVANVVSKIGDSILASLSKEFIKITNNEFNTSDISEWGKQKGVEDKEAEIKKNIEWFNTNLSNTLFSVETVLYTYKLAAALYERAGYSSYYVAHLKRILYLIKDIIELNKDDEKQRKYIKKLLAIGENLDRPFKKLEEIAETIFSATTWNNEVSNRPQILKYRQIFGISTNRDENRQLIYSIVNNISDIRETVVLVESIKLKLEYLFDGDKLKFIEEHFTPGKNISSAYGTINSRYQRMLELKYRTERCFYILNDVLKLGALFENTLLFEEKTPDLEGEINKQIAKIIKEEIKAINNSGNTKITIHDVVSFLIQEALFCSSQLIKKIKLYNPGYVMGYSFIAESHRRMGDWCQVYDNYLRIIDESNDNSKIFEKHSEALKIRESFIREKYSFKDVTFEDTQNWIKNKTEIEKIIGTKSNEKKYLSKILNEEFNNKTTVYSYKILQDLISSHFEEEKPATFSDTYADFYKNHLDSLNILIKTIENSKDLEDNRTRIEQVVSKFNLEKLKDFQNYQITDDNFQITLEVSFESHLTSLEANNNNNGDKDNWIKNKTKINNVLEPFKMKEIKEVLEKEIKTVNYSSVNEEIRRRFIEKLNKEFKNYQASNSFTILKDWIRKNDKIAKLKKGNKDNFLKDNFNDRIKDLLGGEGLIYLESKNHYENAVLYFYKMIELHSDGKAYKDKLHEIHMLEDDYNDSVAHYTIAAERVRINTGKAKEKINKINEKIEKSKLYKYDSYISSGKDEESLDIETINKYLDYFAKEINNE